MLRRGLHQLAHGDFIGRANHHEPGQRAGQAQILNAHLRRSVFADGDAAVRAHRFQIHVGKRRGDAQLLEALVHHEHGEAGDERNLARRGQARADGHHVGFGDAAFEETVRKLLAESGGVGGFRQIGVQHHDVRIRVPQFHQRFAERLARGRPIFNSYLVLAAVFRFITSKLL